MAYLPLLLLLGAALLGIATLYLGHTAGSTTGYRARDKALGEPQMPFLSGSLPREHALSRFHARWYPATLLFLAFDVEMLFMYPWTVVVRSEGIGSVIEMFGFIGVLLVGVVWARREAALRWV